MLDQFSSWQEIKLKHSLKDAQSLASHVASSFEQRQGNTQIRSDVDNVVLNLGEFMEDFIEFEDSKSGDSTYLFWKSYMDMVQTLLLFLRAERDGNWELHLSAFQGMLPLMLWYDHTNYGRWGPVYLADMLKIGRAHV